MCVFVWVRCLHCCCAPLLASLNLCCNPPADPAYSKYPGPSCTCRVAVKQIVKVYYLRLLFVTLYVCAAFSFPYDYVCVCVCVVRSRLFDVFV